MARARSILGSMLSKPNIDIGSEPWYSKAAGQAVNLLNLVRSNRERVADSIKSSINLLPQLSNLIRGKDSIDSYAQVAEELSNKAQKHPELAIYSPIIKGSVSNLREDYRIFTESINKSSEMINDPSFLDTQEKFVNLTENFKEIKGEDGEQKYGNVIEYLTAENERVGTLIGRIESSSKGRQFKYNKNSEYTDEEILNKLESYQKRLSTAVQTAFGDGIINIDEAEYIMAGDVKAYNRFKTSKVNLIKTQYNNIDKAQAKIRSQKLSLEKGLAKDTNLDMIARIFTEEVLSVGGEDVEGIEVTGTTIPGMIENLNSINKGLVEMKEQIKNSYEYWEGRPYYHKIKKAGNKESNDLLKNITVDDGNSINDPIKNNQQNKDKIPPKIKKVLSKGKVKAAWKKLPKEEKKKYGNFKRYYDELLKLQEG